MGVLSYTFFVLVTTSKCFSKLHPVIHREAIIKQFVVELAKCPICFIVSYSLSIEVIGFVGEVIGQQENLSSSLHPTISKVGLAFSYKAMVRAGISTAAILFRSYGFYNQSSRGRTRRRSPSSPVTPMSVIS